MDYNLRQVSHMGQSDVYRVDEKGHLSGIIGKMAWEAESYFTRKFNATYVVRKDASIMNGLDRGDFDFMGNVIWDDLLSNLTTGPVISQRSCMILTRPPIRFMSDSNGLETAF